MLGQYGVHRVTRRKFPMAEGSVREGSLQPGTFLLKKALNSSSLLVVRPLLSTSVMNFVKNARSPSSRMSYIASWVSGSGSSSKESLKQIQRPHLGLHIKVSEKMPLDGETSWTRHWIRSEHTSSLPRGKYPSGLSCTVDSSWYMSLRTE